MVNIWFVPGFKFDPSDKQLLNFYLKAKVLGEKLPIDCIKEKEIYGPRANPWEIFNDSSTQWITGKHELEKVVYIFASLTKIAANKESSGIQGNEHNVRKAGCGMWHDETGRSPIMEGKNLIGHKRMLVFQINDINGLGDEVCLNKVGYWKMHEYFLHGFENYVLCRITFDGSKKTKVIKADSGTLLELI
ncbi:NAC domain containing protein 50-like [Apium graveolens]|uniref:NAC domain containing protein 50-like n=1 Tax=Apium graveolens TaxID=4045 RepID=UPI003D79C14A